MKLVFVAEIMIKQLYLPSLFEQEDYHMENGSIAS